MDEKPKERDDFKFRLLLIYDTDRKIDQNHPLYEEIMLYGQKVEEVHVFMFIKNMTIEDISVSELTENIFIYSLPTKKIFWEIDEIWKVVKNQIVWKGAFRPDFILNFSNYFGAFFGLFLAGKYKRKFFVSTTGAFTEMPFYSKEYLKPYLLLKRADGVFVPGETTADSLINRAGISNDKITVAYPAINLLIPQYSGEKINFFNVYPQHNLFLITETSVSRKRDINFILKVFERVVNKYTRTALFIMVPPEQVSAVKKIVSTATKNSSIYVKHVGEDLMGNFAAANIFLSVSESDEMATSIIKALSVNLPVVTTASGVAKEIFTGSRYEEFMKPFGDIEGFTQAVLRLVENQSLRSEYRLNSPILIKELTLQTLPGHISTILSSIKERDKNVI